MPCLNVVTDSPAVEGALRVELAQSLSKTLSELLNKPEKYVMVTISQATCITMGGVAGKNRNADGPGYRASCRLMSLGDGVFDCDVVPTEEEAKEGKKPHCSLTKKLSEEICGTLEKQLKIAPDCVFIEFSNPPRHMCGWGGKTFAG